MIKEWAEYYFATTLVLAMSFALIITPNLYIALGLTAVVFNYCHERYQIFEAAKEKETFLSLISPMEQQIKELQNAVVILNSTQSLVAKQAEDTKKLISNNNLAQAFVHRNKREARAD